MTSLPGQIAAMLRGLADDFESGKVTPKDIHQSREFKHVYRNGKLLEIAPMGEYSLTLLYRDPKEVAAFEKLDGG